MRGDLIDLGVPAGQILVDLAEKGSSSISHRRSAIFWLGQTRGAFAVNATLWRMRGWRWLVPPLYILFPLLLVEAGVYALVAKNRHRISAAFGMNACRVRFDDDDSDDAVPEPAEVRG